MSLRNRHAKTFFAPTVRFLIVTLGGTHFALHADHVQGLLTIEEAGAVPVLTVQGETYVRIDLAARLQLPSDLNGPETRVVLLRKENARGHLHVDQVHGLKELEPSQVLPLPRQFQGEEQRWYQGLILFADSVAMILNPAWVMEGCDKGAVIGTVERQDERFVTVRQAIVGGQV